jgi:hypothetical protein
MIVTIKIRKTIMHKVFQGLFFIQLHTVYLSDVVCLD